MTHTAASCVMGSTRVLNIQCSMFGTGTSLKTMMKNSQTFHDKQVNSIKRILSQENSMFFMLDNNQKGHSLTFQKFGSSHTFVKVTGTATREYCQHSYIHKTYDTVGDTPITYWNQAILSPLGLLKYGEAFNQKHEIENDMVLVLIT